MNTQFSPTRYSRFNEFIIFQDNTYFLNKKENNRNTWFPLHRWQTHLVEHNITFNSFVDLKREAKHAWQGWLLNNTASNRGNSNLRVEQVDDRLSPYMGYDPTKKEGNTPYYIAPFCSWICIRKYRAPVFFLFRAICAYRCIYLELHSRWWYARGATTECG